MEIRSELRRLGHASYVGKSSVHWIHTVAGRRRGWLDSAFHAAFREALLHALARYAVSCPMYCLMPDHFHVLASGISDSSDQRTFSRRLRTDLNRLLDPLRLQKQAYDHVLRDKETESEAFQSIASYIFDNPVRKGLAASADVYPFSGCVFPGFFGLDPRENGFWDRYWRIYNRVREE